MFHYKPCLELNHRIPAVWGFVIPDDCNLQKGRDGAVLTESL